MKATDVFTALRDPARSNTEKSALLINAITNGIDNVNAQDRLKGTGMEKWSILHHAVSLGNPTALRAVLDAPHIKLHTIDKSGSSPLHLAARSGNDRAVADLLDKQQQMHPDDARSLANYVNATNNACRTPMHLAATAPEGVKVMQRLFDAGGEVDPTTRTGLSTPLSYAVKAFPDSAERSVEAASWLISKGANAETPLLINKTNRSVTASESRQNVADNFTSPLRIAKENNWASLIQVLDQTSTGPLIDSADSTPSGTYCDPANTLTLEQELGHVLANGTRPEIIQSYAIRLCIDCFDKEAALSNAFYDSTTSSYIAMALYNNHGTDTGNRDSMDTLRDCRERFIDNKTAWIDAAASYVYDSIHELVSNPPQSLSEGYSNLRAEIDSFFVDKAYGVVNETIRATLATD